MFKIIRSLFTFPVIDPAKPETAPVVHNKRIPTNLEMSQFRANRGLRQNTAGARGMGYEAGKYGRSASENPYEERTPNYYAWHMGWKTGESDLTARANALHSGVPTP